MGKSYLMDKEGNCLVPPPRFVGIFSRCFFFFSLNTLTTKKGNKFVIVDISFQYNIAKIKTLTWRKLGEGQLIFVQKRIWRKKNLLTKQNIKLPFLSTNEKTKMLVLILLCVHYIICETSTLVYAQ